MKNELKMWIVKREVLATSLEKACHAKGRIYSIEEAAQEFQPESKKKKPIGFSKKNS